MIAQYSKDSLDSRNTGKKFYEEYRRLLKYLYSDLYHYHPSWDEELLLQCVQKLTHRLIFVCLARDAGVIEASEFYQLKQNAKPLDSKQDQQIWPSLKRLFNKLQRFFSGPLFAHDPLLDQLVLKDVVLMRLIYFAQRYEFHQQLNVQLLEYVFEQSISDFDEIRQTHRPGAQEDKKKYASKIKSVPSVMYMAEATHREMARQVVNQYLEEKEKELLRQLGVEELPEAVEEDYASVQHKAGKIIYNPVIDLHVRYWQGYRQYLENLKVLDPFCGSGALLVQVLDFLHEQWLISTARLKRLTSPEDETRRPGQEVFSELPAARRALLARHLYGISATAETAELARLLLWLRIGERNTKPASMQISAGNLFAAANTKKWREQFPQDFDLILACIPRETEGYENMIHSSIAMLAPKGHISLLLPNSFLGSQNAQQMAEHVRPFYHGKIVQQPVESVLLALKK